MKVFTESQAAMITEYSGDPDRVDELLRLLIDRGFSVSPQELHESEIRPGCF